MFIYTTFIKMFMLQGFVSMKYIRDQIFFELKQVLRYAGMIFYNELKCVIY